MSIEHTLFLYNDEAQIANAPAPALQQVKAAFEAYTKSLKDAGVFVTTDWLRLSSTATVLSAGTHRADHNQAPALTDHCIHPTKPFAKP